MSYIYNLNHTVLVYLSHVQSTGLFNLKEIKLGIELKKTNNTVQGGRD